MELADFIGVIWRWKFLVLAVVLIVTGYVLFRSMREQEMYSASVSVVPGLSQIADASAVGIGIEQAGDRISATYAQLVTTGPVLQKALTKANLDWEPERLRSEIATSQPLNTPIIEITVTDSNPQRAQALANAVGEGLVEYSQETTKNGDDAAKAVITNELADIEKQYAAAQPTGTNPNAITAQAMVDRRNTVLKDYDNLLNQETSSSDVKVLGTADSYNIIPTKTTQNTLIALIVSLAIGISLAFILEGARKAIAQAGVTGSTADHDSRGDNRSASR